MTEIDFYSTVVPLLMAALFIGVCLSIVLTDPIDNWLDRMKKRRAKPA